MADNELSCGCGYSVQWESGNYFGERTDMSHHKCGSRPQAWQRCGDDCAHSYVSCARDPEHPAHPEHPDHAVYVEAGARRLDPTTAYRAWRETGELPPARRTLGDGPPAGFDSWGAYYDQPFGTDAE
ncbi:hypothetical protein P3T37_004348 [Kitasatospora sp. MAA4]|uniref:hypothetical protein n=1 Tax=Kitasatospora sp. MAA4 TaxID=3035093 RepID=UPI0024747DBF|nr:hypothetical protein [Kitasatospora sp. MAA4]MDH6134939.1 hypothetical protein [Kitasatospora sp. MAA4]